MWPQICFMEHINLLSGSSKSRYTNKAPSQLLERCRKLLYMTQGTEPIARKVPKPIYNILVISSHRALVDTDLCMYLLHALKNKDMDSDTRPRIIVGREGQAYIYLYTYVVEISIYTYIIYIYIYIYIYMSQVPGFMAPAPQGTAIPLGGFIS